MNVAAKHENLREIEIFLKRQSNPTNKHIFDAIFSSAFINSKIFITCLEAATGGVL